MKSNFRLYPYKMGSKSAKAITKKLNGLRVFSNKNFKPKSRHILINWGTTKVPQWWNQNLNILNKFEAVLNAKNKIRTLTLLKNNNVPCLEFTQSKNEALIWVQQGFKVYCRTMATSHAGQGIVIATNESELVNAPLFTKGVDVRAEYRVHVFNGQVIDYIKKRRELDNEPTEEQLAIRNYHNGWIFTRNNLRRLERVEEMAINAVRVLGLDFGAVDIIRDQNNTCFVLEINTACGLEGTTLENYTTAILNHYGQ